MQLRIQILTQSTGANSPPFSEEALHLREVCQSCGGNFAILKVIHNLLTKFVGIFFVFLS